MKGGIGLSAGSTRAAQNIQRKRGDRQVRRRLSNYEQETIINFNKDETIAHIFTYEKTWQQHLEKRLGLKPTMDNGFGGKAYEIPKKRIRPPRAPIELSADAKAKLAGRLRHSRDFTSQNTKLQAKSEAKNKTRLIPLTNS